jgi:hypothetical protein
MFLVIFENRCIRHVAAGIFQESFYRLHISREIFCAFSSGRSSLLTRQPVDGEAHARIGPMARSRFVYDAPIGSMDPVPSAKILPRLFT